MQQILSLWKTTQAKLSPRSRIILSETATTGDGGCPGLSNSYAAGFFWINQLGFVAKQGYWQVLPRELTHN